MPKIGDWIQIICMEGEPRYTGKIGEITHIDDIGQLHGTWGGCAIIPGTDEFDIIENPMNSFAKKENLEVRTSYDIYDTLDGDKIYVPRHPVFGKEE